MTDAALLRMVDVFLDGARKPLVVILGPTAGGKTALSIELARYIEAVPRGREAPLRVEIVNADSRQLYRYLDIGTAKITGEEMKGIHHHLLSVKNPKEEVTVGWYQEEATKAVDDVLRRENIPLLVGGSMLYVSSIVDGLSLAPAADPSLRKRLEAAYDEDGGARLYRRLQTIDPDAAATIHPNNRPYVIRALEIYETLKRPKTASVKRRRCPYDLLMIGVELSMDGLLRRIEERTERMFEDGWIGEVRDLLARGYTDDDPGMRSHGYREIIRYIGEVEEGGSDVDDDAALELLKRRIIMRTRQYAKRQMSWWRNDQRIHWFVTDTVAAASEQAPMHGQG